jgi:hypothetical protein
MKEFLLTILSEMKRPQTQCLSPKGEFWVCSKPNFRILRNSFQRAKGGLSTSRLKINHTKKMDETIMFIGQWLSFLPLRIPAMTPSRLSF